MEQNITDLYDFIRTLDEKCRNVDLSDVPQTGEKIEIKDAFTKEWTQRKQ